MSANWIGALVLVSLFGAAQCFIAPFPQTVTPFSRLSRDAALPLRSTSPSTIMGLFDFFQKPKPTAAPIADQAAPVLAETAVPRSYDEIHAQAIAAVQSGLASGIRKMEVEFPPIAQVNKLSDGSASSQRLVRRANVDFAVKAAQQLAGQARSLFLVSADPEAVSLLSSQNLPGNVQLGPLSAAAAAANGDVIMVLTPATNKEWADAAAQAGRAPVVILNGVFSNGYPSFEMAYYLKPMTFNTQICGYLIRQFPSDWTVFSGADGRPLEINVKFVSAQGCVRPDLQTISNALTR